MTKVTDIFRVKFSVGDLIQHRLFDYRGVIVDVDRTFQATDEWYQVVARSRPPKDKPWSHVLVHDSENSPYVAEQNLNPDISSAPIVHPMLEHFFCKFDQGKYIRNKRVN